MYKVAGIILISLMFHASVQAKSCNRLESLAWMVGDWHSESSKLRINESWNKISEQTFEGTGSTYSIKKQKAVSAETLRLVEMSGEVFYVAKVASNELPVSFKLTSCTNGSAVFENAQHDFPKKLSYQLNKDDGLTVFVSGAEGKGFTIEFVRRHDN